MRRVRCELLGEIVELVARPERVVCPVPGWTEARWAMGLEGRVAGVSKSRRRYVDTGIARGSDLIHDGPSPLETARWLRGQLLRAGA